MTTTLEGIHPSNIQATIEQIRYWVPTIKDVALVVEARDEDSWLLSIEPKVASACPVAIALKDKGTFDITIAGEHYADRSLSSLDHLVRLLEQIVEGGVVQRRWMSTVTGAQQGLETLVSLGDGILWRNGGEPAGGAERRDRHFLPYRRI